MKVVGEVAGVFIAGVVAFVLMLVRIVFAIAIGCVSLACFVCIVVALFAATGFALTHTQHTMFVTLAYLGYAAALFGVAVVMIYVPGRLREVAALRQNQQALSRIGELRLANDASFNSR